MKKYSNDFKKMLAELVIIDGSSTSKVAKGYSVPLKTLEKWITLYNKNNRVFGGDDPLLEDELRKANRRIQELEVMVDALKKAQAFLTKQNLRNIK